jgi:hypothetical protein
MRFTGAVMARSDRGLDAVVGVALVLVDVDVEASPRGVVCFLVCF